jgi:hypothetical protein
MNARAVAQALRWVEQQHKVKVKRHARRQKSLGERHANATAWPAVQSALVMALRALFSR